MARPKRAPHRVTWEDLNPPRCSQEIFPDLGGHKLAPPEQCSRKGVIEEGGKLWCFQHAPSRVSRQHARQADINRERYEKLWKPRSHAIAMLRIIREIANGTVTDPVALCVAFMSHYERVDQRESQE